jgi:hypothetical protein
MYGRGSGQFVSQQIFEEFADKCVLPAMRVAMPEHLSHFPYSYAAERTRVQATSGFRFSTYDIPQDRLETFGMELMARCEAIEHFEHAFFVTELRGIKGRHPHDPQNQLARRAAYDQILSCLDASNVDIADWTVDVGLEVRDRRGHVVVWKETMHARMLAHTLHVSLGRAHTIINGRGWKLDLAAQINSIAGFRCPLNAATANPDQDNRVRASYIQAYTTDKTVHYQTDGSATTAFSKKETKDLLPGRSPALLSRLEKMLGVVGECMSGGTMETEEIDEEDDALMEEQALRRQQLVSNHRQARDTVDDVLRGEDGPLLLRGQPGSARIEVRVPMAYVEHALTNWSYDDVREMTLSFAPSVWW